MKYAFMHQHIRQFSVVAMSRVLKVSRSGLYDWCKRKPSPRQQANTRLLPDIRRVHQEHRQAYGAYKTWRALNDAGVACGKHCVARLRREAGIVAKREARFQVMMNIIRRRKRRLICCSDSFWHLHRIGYGSVT